MRAALPAIACLLAACGARGEASEPEIEVPERPPTAAEELLDRVPAGADLVVEVDLSRLRANPTVGPLLRAVADESELGLGYDLLGGTDLAVVAVYGIGGEGPRYLTFVRGEEAASLPETSGARLDDETVALGPPELLERVGAADTEEERSMADDARFMRVRALAMPERAPGASLRVAGRFDFDGRVAISRTFELEAVPGAVSLWGDVVDDLAIVGIFGGEDENEALDLARTLLALREQIAASRLLTRLVLGYVVRSAEVKAEGSVAQLVLVVGPRRLTQISERLQKWVSR